MCADAWDDGYVKKVEFYANGTRVGLRTNCVPCANPVNPFCINWPNVPAGAYELTAVATDSGGATATSYPVHITVGARSKLAPGVRITSPPNRAAFLAPAYNSISAYCPHP